MSSRDIESEMLDRCIVVALGTNETAENQIEANVFRLAASTILSKLPSESEKLMTASKQYFSKYPDKRLAPQDVIARGWVISMPRLRNMLLRRFKQCDNFPTNIK